LTEAAGIVHFGLAQTKVDDVLATGDAMGVVAQAFPANPLPSSPKARRTSCGRCSSPASKRRSRFCACSAQAKRLIHPAFAKAGSQWGAPDGQVPAFFLRKPFTMHANSFFPMTRHRFDLQDLPATPWKNGGGLTREVNLPLFDVPLSHFIMQPSIAVPRPSVSQTASD
jgi:hypothetical protein